MTIPHVACLPVTNSQALQVNFSIGINPLISLVMKYIGMVHIISGVSYVFTHLQLLKYKALSHTDLGNIYMWSLMEDCTFSLIKRLKLKTFKFS